MDAHDLKRDWQCRCGGDLSMNRMPVIFGHGSNWEHWIACDTCGRRSAKFDDYIDKADECWRKAWASWRGEPLASKT